MKVTAGRGEPADLASNDIVPVVFKGVFRRDGSLLHAEAVAYIDAPALLSLDHEPKQIPQTTAAAQP